MPVAVFVLGLTVFSLGTTEFMVAGLLPELSAEFDVTVSQAGWLISVFALGVVIGAPLITAATTRIPRKAALIGLLVIFIAGEVVATLAGSFEVLMAARVVTAVAHGAFFGIGAVLAADLVEPERRARAISIMFGGLTIATIAGVPLGTFLGQQIGWRAAFGAVAVLGIVDLIGVATLVPKQPAQSGGLDLRRELSAFANTRVWLALATTMLSQAGLYTAYTYIAPLLTDVTGFAPGWVAPLLGLFGVGTFIGSLIGGRLADRSLMATLCLGLIGLAAILAAFTLTAGHQVAMVVTLALFGVGAFVINPALQTRVMNLADHAPTLASTSNISAFNLGNALGPWLGGLGISSGAGLLAPSWIGALLALAALAVAVASLAADRRVRAWRSSNTPTPEHD
ncbi:MFS transporter, DHA1 family, arabinose polymer transporter [Brevibacterium sandarakinum]|uniref:MFS transporter, DHA1 family, arabinose polymer transporter n=1 Tax=Brevibacterium sandarakinum TaxID=629680 RepID=A0A1H1NZY2_BRESA|nr:Cmx/CmrA family chloramphenicol efflux MFS transporter [Brevibacterium sandarakinum]SDS04503.1 MFS transporter, DHA1 family, arabinose polymer transporter [Brevibacterium sandarakinum]